MASNVFYKGEDITIDVTLFVDDNMTIVDSLESYQIDILMYTRHDGKTIFASTQRRDGVDVVIYKVDNNKSGTFTIPAHLSAMLDVGHLTTEMRVTGSDGYRSINIHSGITIEPSRICKHD